MFKEEIKRICKELNINQIPYIIIGGQAVLLYGEPRLTRDIDITLGINTDRLLDILQITKKLKLQPLPDDVKTFVEETMVLPVLGRKGIRVDFIFSYTDYERKAITRANKVMYDDEEIFYASKEDVIIHKIIAGRERDLEDAKIIIAKQSLDEKYIIKCLSKFEKTFDKHFVKIYKDLMKKSKI